MLHSCAALETQDLRFNEHDGHFGDVLCYAKACKMVIAVLIDQSLYRRVFGTGKPGKNWKNPQLFYRQES